METAKGKMIHDFVSSIVLDKEIAGSSKGEDLKILEKCDIICERSLN